MCKLVYSLEKRSLERDKEMSKKYFHLLLTAITLLLMVTSTMSYIVERDGLPADVSTVTDMYTYTETSQCDCTKCYRSLVRELLKNATNYFNMQMIFFPPNGTSPDFVIVTYNYGTDSEDTGLATSSQTDSEVWFWSSAVYYFFHPIKIFQFTSLGFSDPLLDQSTLMLYLPAECANISEAFKRLLTQRVSYTVIIDIQPVTHHNKGAEGTLYLQVCR